MNRSRRCTSPFSRRYVCAYPCWLPDKTAGPVAKSLFWGLDERKLSQRLATLINDVVEVVSGRLPSDYEIFGEAGSNNLERFQELCGQVRTLATFPITSTGCVQFHP